MRKVVGARKGAIIRQFMGEALIYALIAFAVSLVLVELLKGDLLSRVRMRRRPDGGAWRLIRGQKNTQLALLVLGRAEHVAEEVVGPAEPGAVCAGGAKRSAAFGTVSTSSCSETTMSAVAVMPGRSSRSGSASTWYCLRSPPQVLTSATPGTDCRRGLTTQ